MTTPTHQPYESPVGVGEDGQPTVRIEVQDAIDAVRDTLGADLIRSRTELAMKMAENRVLLGEIQRLSSALVEIAGGVEQARASAEQAARDETARGNGSAPTKKGRRS